MKKRSLALIMASVTLISALFACTANDGAANGNDVTEQTTTVKDNNNDIGIVTDPDKIYGGDYFDYDLTPFMTVPTLSFVKVDKQSVENLYKYNRANALSSLNSFADVASGEKTELYDTVNIDFKGIPKDESLELDADVLAGMESAGYSIVLGSGTFIGAYDHPTNDTLDTDGFEDQMIGMTVGETKDILVTFPDDYGQAVLAGVQTVFTVKINSCKRPADIDDEVAKKNGYDSAADFEAQIMNLSKQSAAVATVMTEAQIISYPVGDLELLCDYYIDSYIDYYYGGSVSAEKAEEIASLLADTASAWAQSYAKERMVIKYIANQNGISTTEKELADYAQKEAEAFGLDSGDTLIAYYGKDTVWYNFLYSTVVELIAASVSFEN